MIKLPDSVHWEFEKEEYYTRVRYRGEVVGRIANNPEIDGQFLCLRRCAGSIHDRCNRIWMPNDGDKWIPVTVSYLPTHEKCVNWIQEKYTF